MQQIGIDQIDTILAEQRGLWSAKECAAPKILDKTLNYLISYYCSPAAARRSLRLFNGIDTHGDIAFASWNEVRVATLADIERALRACGCQGAVWELAVTIKDFLQNMFDTLGFVSFEDEDIDVAELQPYLKQLQGTDSWEKDAISPFRPPTSSWLRRTARKPGEAILPEPVVQYLRYLLGQTGQVPYDYHSEKVLTRLGILNIEMPFPAKKAIYYRWIGEVRPLTKHRKLIEFSKLVCLERQPRCSICPLAKDCNFSQKNLIP